jgi:large subunit ribosomal protein L4
MEKVINQTSVLNSLDPQVFNVKPSTQAIFDVIMSERAAIRNNVQHTKDRSEVSGGGRKP